MTGRDIIVIGASAGGVSALRDLARGLPADLPATLFVVVHSSPSSPGVLPRVLSKAGPLPATHAKNGQRFRRGCIYVAPPDRHLLIADGVMHLASGPRENGFRPAVDPLFRTAANQHGARVVGIVLSGALDDGTRGLQRIKHQGGIAIAQSVDDAAIPGMPQSAIRNVDVDHVLPAAEMPTVIVRLASGSRAAIRKPPATRARRNDVAEHGSRLLETGHLGPPSAFTCTECGGALWQHTEDGVTSFSCHVGHAFSAESLGDGLDNRVEVAMWTAFRTLEESVVLQRRLAERARARGLSLLARTHDARARAAAARATIIQKALTGARTATSRRSRPRPSAGPPRRGRH